MAAILIARTHGFAGLRAVAQAEMIFGRGILAGVVVHFAVQPDIVVYPAVGKGQQIGMAAAPLHTAAVEQYVVTSEIQALAETGRETFCAISGIIQAGLHRHGKEVGGVNAVVAGEAVFTEQLAVVETVFRSIKQRNIVLLFGGDVGVEQARL